MKTGCFVLTVLLAALRTDAQIVPPPATEPADSSAPASVSGTGHKSSQAAPVFKSGIDVVALNVVVTDAHDKFVTGLDVSDFAVYEDGVRQDISFFAAGDVPLDLALVIDTSSSMADRIDTMRQAAVGFASTIRPSDRISVVEVKSTVRTLYRLGSEVDAAVASIRAVRPAGGTALYNGLYITLKEFAMARGARDEVRRQAIVLFSDGEDTVSLVGYDDVMELAKQSGLAIYTIMLKAGVDQATTGGSGRYLPGTDFAMRSLAQETGGRAFFPARIEELEGIYSTIASELANQYAIGYTSNNPRRDGVYRRLTVRVADRPDVRTRARSGYVAARADAAARFH